MCQIVTDRESGQAKQDAGHSQPPTEAQAPTAAALCQIPPCEATTLDEREFLPENWAGFGFDRDGLLITRSGYRCSPQSLESALWLVGCMRADARKLLLRSDEAAGALRPLYETSDADDTGQVQPTRLRLVEDQKRVTGGAHERPGEPQRLDRDVAQGKPVTPDQDQERAGTERPRQTSAAQEPPLQRLRRAAAGQILITPRSAVEALAGANAPTAERGAFPLI